MSKALNELKKATMASYLSKAGRSVRTNTSLGKEFDDASFPHLKAMNKNHPNVVTPGYKKDPEKYKSAASDYEANAGLADKFHLKAAKRIKGIALAGRRLAKEEITEETLKEETLDEVSRSTIAKVATARYNQAQTALKQKDFGGYVKKMSKAIKAGDATTPKTGWSPEDDNTKKNEEVVPVLSAQEKYRQIKEAKLAKSAKSTTTHHNYYIYHDDLAKGASALKKAGIPHHVADHSKGPVEHSIISVRHKHTEKADEVLKSNKINYGGR